MTKREERRREKGEEYPMKAKAKKTIPKKQQILGVSDIVSEYHAPVINVRADGKSRKFDLQDRFIDYAVEIVKVAEAMPNTRVGNHISMQLLRSGTSSAANYGEAQSGESKADFIHKLKLALKELRETEVWLKIIKRTGLIMPNEKFDSLLSETNELISILFTSIGTASTNK